MLSEEKIDSLTNELNAKVNLPLLGERGEGKIIKEFLKKVNAILHGELGDKVYGYINNASDGISPEEAGEIKSKITEVLNNRVNIPILKADQKNMVFGFLADKLSDALQKNKSV